MNENKDNLDQAIAEMYRSEHLPSGRMAIIVDEITAPRSFLTLPRLLAASFVLLVTGLAVIFAVNRILSSGAREVAEDVQRHHVKTFIADVTADNFPALVTKMTALDFTPIIPARLKDQPLTVVGGRYCSLGKSHGAQVRLRDPAGKFMTLCEFREADAGHVADSQFTIDGLDITVWHENGLVVAMTAPTQ